MPCHYAAFDHGSTVFEVWSGHITHAELVAHQRTQLQDPAVRPGAIVLADARDASFETEADKVEEFTSEYGRSDNIGSTSKCALLVNYDTWDRAQLFAEQAKQFGVTVIVFNSVEIASTWLGIDPQLAEQRLQSLATRGASAGDQG